MKRSILIILVLLMLTWIMPASFATLISTNDGSIYGTKERSVSEGLPVLSGYTYVFNHASHHADENGNPDNVIEEGEAFKQINNSVWTIDNTTSSSDKWGFVRVNGSNYTVRGESSGTVYDDIDWKYQITDIENGPSFDPETNSLKSLVLEIDIGKPGEYIPSFSFNRHSSSPKMEIFLVKATEDIDTWRKNYPTNVFGLDTFSRIGVVDMYGTGTSTEVFLPIKISEAGRYYLIFVPNSVNENWNAYKDSSNRYFCYSRPKSFALGEKTSEPLIYNLTMSVFDEKCPASGTSTSGFIGVRESKKLLANFELADWEYYLNRHTTGVQDKNATETNPSYTVGEGYYAMNLNYTDAWKCEFGNSHKNLNSSQLNVNAIRFEPKANYYNRASTSERPTFAIRLYVPYSGRFDIEFKNNIANTNGTDTAVYFFKAPGEELVPGAVTDAYIKDVNLLENGKRYSSVVVCDYTKFSTVNIPSAGEYIVLFDTKDGNKDVTDSNGRQLFTISGIKLTPVTALTAAEVERETIINEDGGNIAPKAEGRDTTAKVNALAAYINGDEVVGSVIDTSKAMVGSDFTVSAPDVDGYSFLYWAKAASNNKQIVSFEPKYTFKPITGTTSLIALYKANSQKEINSVSFYNGNGQLIKSFDNVENVTIPSLPIMSGYGKATHWALFGSEIEYVAGANVAVSGEMVFVAQYKDLEQNVSITAVNGEGSGMYTYGETVVLSAPIRKGNDVFNYWMKGEEIVSFDREYTFNAWKDCTVTAVYKTYEPIADKLCKIIINENGNELMAEFVGLGDAIEKGIIFGGDSLNTASAKMAMVTNGNQFAVYDDVDGDGIGYAILKDGSVVYGK